MNTIDCMTQSLNEKGILREVIAKKSIKNVVAGQKYPLQRIDHYACVTQYQVADMEYNSVLFEEDLSSPLMKALGEVKEGNELKLVATLKRAQVINLAVGQYQTIITPEELLGISVGGVLTIGRGEGCSLRNARFEHEGEFIEFGFNLSVSRMHAIVYREADNKWRILDVSSFGTSLILG